MQDVTIVVPTYNRPKDLRRLLTFFQATETKSVVAVLDSSRPAERDENRRLISELRLDLRYHEYSIDTHPFDKFRDGVARVETPFCAMCADDDLVLPRGTEACVAALRADARIAVAQGFSFQFMERDNGDLDLVNVLYFAPTIDDPTPLGRLARQFEQYQATTYGHFRTEALRSVFDGVQSVPSILGRELLSTALAVVQGKVMRVPLFSNGRGMGPSASYEHWHPLEWFAKNAAGMGREYMTYRDLLATAVQAQADNPHNEATVRRILDLIHLLYLVKHAPPSALRFMCEAEMEGAPFSRYWPDHRIQIPLIEASGVGRSPPQPFKRLINRLRARIGSRARPNATEELELVPTTRRYILRRDFLKFCHSTFGERALEAARSLVEDLEAYGGPAVADLETAA